MDFFEDVRILFYLTIVTENDVRRFVWSFKWIKVFEILIKIK